MATATTRTAFPGYFIIHTVKKAADNGSDKLNEFKEKYVSQTMNSGRDFLEAQYEKIEDLVERMVKQGQTIRTETGERLTGWMPLRKPVLRPGDWAQTIERKISQGFDMALDRINLARRTDIEHLAEAMQALERKMDALITPPAPARPAPKPERTGILYRKF